LVVSNDEIVVILAPATAGKGQFLSSVLKQSYKNHNKLTNFVTVQQCGRIVRAVLMKLSVGMGSGFRIVAFSSPGGSTLLWDMAQDFRWLTSDVFIWQTQC